MAPDEDPSTSRPGHEHPDPVRHAPDRRTAEDWDEAYSGEDMWSGNPNAPLVAEAADLPAARVLDIGCGEGADAVWLAERGWDVTALDISGEAVRKTLAAADKAGVALSGVAAPLLEAELEGPFELVSAMYPALERTPDDDAERRIAELVAPGGTLLFVHHADIDREHALSHGFDPDDFVAPADMLRVLEAEGTWDIEKQELRPREVAGGAGAHHKADLVVRARKWD